MKHERPPPQPQFETVQNLVGHPFRCSACGGQLTLEEKDITDGTVKDDVCRGPYVICPTFQKEVRLPVRFDIPKGMEDWK